MGATIIPTFKTRLLDLIRARPALAGVQAEYALPAGNLEDRRLFFSDDVDADRTISGMREGRKVRQESAEFGVFCEAYLEGGTQAEAEASAIALATEVEDLLADDPMLGRTIVGLQAARVTNWSLAAGPTGVGHLARVVVSVRYDARLT